MGREFLYFPQKLMEVMVSNCGSDCPFTVGAVLSLENDHYSHLLHLFSLCNSYILLLELSSWFSRFSDITVLIIQISPPYFHLKLIQIMLHVRLQSIMILLFLLLLLTVSFPVVFSFIITNPIFISFVESSRLKHIDLVW